MNSSVSAIRPPLVAALLAVIAVGCGAHLAATWQPAFGDEFVVVQNIWRMISERTIIPPHAIYPALYTYLIAPAVVLSSAVRVWLGAPPAYEDLSELMTLCPLTAFWPARLVTMLSWVACLWVLYVLARGLWQEPLPALVSAAAFAAAFGPMRYSGYALPDVPMMLLMALALLFAVRLVLGEHPLRNATWAGLAAGLAIATKYQAVAVLVPLAWAAWGCGPQRLPIAGRMALAAAVGFIIGCPGWLLAPDHYWDGLMSVREHMAQGHIGAGGVPVLGQLELLLRADPLLAALGLLAWVVLLLTWGGREDRTPPQADADTASDVCGPRSHQQSHRSLSRQALVLLLVAGLAVVAVAAPARKQSLQFVFGAYPVLCLGLGGAIAALGRRHRPLALVPVVAGILASLGLSVGWAYRVVALPDGTIVARQWLNHNLPGGAVIAVDWNYVPRLLDQAELAGLRAQIKTDWLRSRYAPLRGFPTVPMGWTEESLRTTAARYIITSSWCYDRFFEFGLFTMLPPPPGSPLRAQFDQTRRFYEALLSGYQGWGLVQCIDTGNGPRVLVFERGSQVPCEPGAILPEVGVADWPCR